MLVIREEQLAVFARLPRIAFEQQMVDHFFQYYPVECEELGETQLQAFVQFGIERSSRWGCSSQREVAFYLAVMFCLGSYFDEDPLYSWARSDLENKGRGAKRIEKLFDATIRYLETTTGTDGTQLAKALIHLRKFDLTPLESLEPGSLPEYLHTQWQLIYPEKCQRHDDGELTALITESITLAAQQNFLTAKGQAIFATMAFMQGIGFAEDPLYPWVATVINDSTLENDEMARASKLLQAALQHINHSLQSSEANSQP